MNEEASAKYACEVTELSVEEIDSAGGGWAGRGRGSGLDSESGVGERVKGIGVVEEQDHEHEAHTEGIDFDEEREVALQEH